MAFETSGKCTPGIKYALISNNTVQDIFDGKNLAEYNAEQVKLIALPQGQEYKYCVGQILNQNAELEPLSLEQFKQIQVTKIAQRFEQEIYQTQKEYIPLEEMLTFEMQYQEAKLIHTDNPTPFLDSLAEHRGQDKAELAKKILEKHDTYIDRLAKLLGQKSKAIKQVEGCVSIEEVLKINEQTPTENN